MIAAVNEHNPGNVWIEQERDPPDAGSEFLEHLEPFPDHGEFDDASSKPICRSRAQNLFAASCLSEPVPATIISNHCCRTRSSQVTWAQHLRTERTSVRNQRDQRENNNKLLHDTSPCFLRPS